MSKVCSVAGVPSLSFKDRPSELKAEKLQLLISNDNTKVPIIFVPHFRSKLRPIEEVKLFCSRKNQLRACTKVLREKINLDMDSSLQFSVGNHRILKLTDCVGELYDAHRDPKDLYLYIKYGEIEAFGHKY